MSDVDARTRLLDGVKDSTVEFLLEYLPHIEVHDNVLQKISIMRRALFSCFRFFCFLCSVCLPRPGSSMHACMPTYRTIPYHTMYAYIPHHTTIPYHTIPKRVVF